MFSIGSRAQSPAKAETSLHICPGRVGGVRAVALGHRNPALTCPCHGGPVNLLGPHCFATKITAPLLQSRMAVGSSDRPGWGVLGSGHRPPPPWPAVTWAVPGTRPVPVRCWPCCVSLRLISPTPGFGCFQDRALHPGLGIRGHCEKAGRQAERALSEMCRPGYPGANQYS